MSYEGAVGDPVPLVMCLPDGATDQYPQAEIYKVGDGSPTATISLASKGKGRYEATWTPSEKGSFVALFLVYADAGHTVVNIAYGRSVESIEIRGKDLDDVVALLTRIAGLSHENVYIDNTTYTEDGQMSSARMRCFDSKTNAEAATDGGTETTGLVCTYLINSDYEGLNKLKTFRAVLSG